MQLDEIVIEINSCHLGGGLCDSREDIHDHPEHEWILGQLHQVADTPEPLHVLFRSPCWYIADMIWGLGQLGVQINILFDLSSPEGDDHNLLKKVGCMRKVQVAGGCCFWLKVVAVDWSEVLSAAADDHLDLPLSRLVKVISGMEIEPLVTFVVPITNQNKLSGLPQLLNLLVREISLVLQMLLYHVLVRCVDCFQVHKKWNGSSWFVFSPKLVLQMHTKRRLSRSRVTKDKKNLPLALQEIPRSLL